MIFDSIEDGYTFYQRYAHAVGFSVRKYTSRKLKNSDTVKLQLFVCSKEGYKKTNELNPMRKRSSARVGCEAKIILKYFCGDGFGYAVSTFYEGHSHSLSDSSQSLFEKHGRDMNLFHKNFVVANSKVITISQSLLYSFYRKHTSILSTGLCHFIEYCASFYRNICFLQLNVGPSKSYNQVKELVGGHDNVGASKQDFKNFQRDLKAFIKDTDAQMFMDNFNKKKDMWSSFFFEYEVDDDMCLCRVLWCDPICLKNYALYGDIVSFDTTFKTNKYVFFFFFEFFLVTLY